MREPVSTKDPVNVIAKDLIMRGSECFGVFQVKATESIFAVVKNISTVTQTECTIEQPSNFSMEVLLILKV